MSKNIVFEGWLTKSPPTKRIWRAKWRRRWFALRQSGELPGQYLLDYYADRNCRRLKGTINLDLCEQVDAGLRMERGNGSLDNKIRGSVFTVRTQSRTYHLEAECEEDMAQWVDAICRVCGLRATEDSNDFIGTYENGASNRQQLSPDGVYIPISECITGVRVQDMHTNFTYDPRSTVSSKRFQRIPTRARTTESRLDAIDNWDSESNVSAEDCASLNTSQAGNGNWSVTKSFTRLTVHPRPYGNGASTRSKAADEGPIVPYTGSGPPVPPRPPKTFQGPKMEEPVESNTNGLAPHPSPQLRVPHRMSHGSSPTSPGRLLIPHSHQRYTDDEDEPARSLAPYPSPKIHVPRRLSHGSSPSSSPGRLLIPHYHHRCIDDEDEPAHSTIQYCNIPSLPPAVDRARKPRYGVHCHSFGHIHTLLNSRNPGYHHDGTDVLQYLDLDLATTKPPAPKPQDGASRKKVEFLHGKSLSVVETNSAYKTVDFLKTEAFNITRKDAEASRNIQN